MYSMAIKNSKHLEDSEMWNVNVWLLILFNILFGKCQKGMKYVKAQR